VWVEKVKWLGERAQWIKCNSINTSKNAVMVENRFHCWSDRLTVSSQFTSSYCSTIMSSATYMSFNSFFSCPNQALTSVSSAWLMTAHSSQTQCYTITSLYWNIVIPIPKKTRQHNNEVCSCNHCYTGQAIRITFSVCL
jgi:hypothetical protein